MGQEAEIEIPPVAVAQKLNAPPGSAAVTYGVSAPPESTPVVAIPAGNAPSSVPMWQQEKLGGKCCGCCCDYRRAVIIIAILSLISAALSGILSQRVFGSAGGFLEGDRNARIGLILFGVITSIASLIGALKFNIFLVGFNVVGYLGKYWSGLAIILYGCIHWIEISLIRLTQ